MPGTAADVVRIARTQLGVIEEPTNRVPYWPGAGLPDLQGQPWCGAFVWWCLRQAGVGALPSTARRFVYTPTGLADWTAARRIIPAGSARPGDVAWFSFDTQPGPEHVGLVVDISPTGGLTTVEGNTSPDNQGSQANGGGVYERHRSYGLICGIGRPPYQAQVVVRGYLRAQTPPITGAAVSAVQRIVGSGVDGAYGPLTAKAVARWQRAHGLAADGIVGPATAAAMGLAWAAR